MTLIADLSERCRTALLQYGAFAFPCVSVPDDEGRQNTIHLRCYPSRPITPSKEPTMRLPLIAPSTFRPDRSLYMRT
jgi:hypothetical protein